MLCQCIGFDVQKTGEARIGLVGFPSVGKSTLLNSLTGSFSEVADYEFTTLTCVPGLFEYKGARMQLLDLPGIIEGAKDGKGRGRQVIAVARTCSLLLIVLDATKPMTHRQVIERECEGFGIRLNKKPPEITIRRREKGGLSMTSTCTLTNLDYDMVRVILQEYRLMNVDICFRCDATADELIDAIEGNRIYVPCLYVVNKIDQSTIEELNLFSKMTHSVVISANHKWNFEELLEKIWVYLDLIRIYTKPRGQIPDYTAPVVVSSSLRTVEQLCNKIHKAIMRQFKYAWVWGKSVKHTPQKVGKDHVLEDEDVIQVVKN
jgi:uncharacterized protein